MPHLFSTLYQKKWRVTLKWQRVYKETQGLGFTTTKTYCVRALVERLLEKASCKYTSVQTHTLIQPEPTLTEVTISVRKRWNRTWRTHTASMPLSVNHSCATIWLLNRGHVTEARTMALRTQLNEILRTCSQPRALEKLLAIPKPGPQPQLLLLRTRDAERERRRIYFSCFCHSP